MPNEQYIFCGSCGTDTPIDQAIGTSYVGESLTYWFCSEACEEKWESTPHERPVENYTEEPERWGLVTVNWLGHELHGRTLYFDETDYLREDEPDFDDDDDDEPEGGEEVAICIDGIIGKDRYFTLPFHILRPANEIEVARFSKKHGSYRNLSPSAAVASEQLGIRDYESAGPNKKKDSTE